MSASKSYKCLRKNGLGRFLGALALGLVAGCLSVGAGMQGIKLNQVLEMEHLQRKDYSVLGTVTGSGCSTYVGLWPIPIFWFSNEGGSGQLYGLDLRNDAEEAAVYAAIESMKGADALIAPRYHEEVSSAGIWYRNVCVKVIGKAIVINPDPPPKND